MLDAARFTDRVAAARGFQDAPERIAVLKQALALWRGPAYGEFSAGFAADAARRLEEERAAAVEALAQAAGDRRPGGGVRPPPASLPLPRLLLNPSRTCGGLST
jgi:hypothetical protein